MTSPPDDTTTDLHAIIAALRAERDAALSEKARLAADYQAATVDVLKAMSASPGNPQPVFDLIVRRAQELCNSRAAGIFEYDGELVHLSSHYGDRDIAGTATYFAAFPMMPIRGSIPCRAILDKQVVHIRDMRAEPELLPIVRDLAIRSGLAIPLLRDGAAIGAFIINSMEPGGFSDAQVALSQTFAEQAVIAITSAETYRNLHEALEQQTATADVLEVINTSPGNLAPVFDAMLEKAMRLCGAAFGMLRSFDGEQMHTVATRGVPPAFAEYSARNALTPMLATGPARALETGQPAQTVDIMEGVAYQSGEPGARALANLGGARTILHIPLFKDQTSVGLFSFYRQEVRAFTEKQIALLEGFANQAVIAMENARLLTEQREALEQQTATAEVLQVINASPGNLTPVFDAILEKAHNLCGAPLGSLVLRDGERLRAVATRGYPHEYEALARQGFSPTDPFGLLLSGEPFVHVPDAATRPAVPHESDPMLRGAVGIGGIRTALFVPLRKETTVLGYISAQRQEVRLFTDKQIALLQNFAAQAVIAMENARLLTEQREALEQQTATAEVLQAINASPGDLAPVFDAMLERAMRLCGAQFGQLVTTADGQVFTVAAAQGPTAIVEFLRNRPPTRPGPGTSIHRLVQGERRVHIPDVTSDEAYQRGDTTRRALVDLGGCRTLVTVGLRKEDALLGAITVYRQEMRPFSEKEIALLESFAAQAVIAMENARLITEQREALEQQTATAEVLQVINASPGNLAPVFGAMLEKAIRLCDTAYGIFATYDGDAFLNVAWRGVPPALVQREEFLGAPIRPRLGALLYPLMHGEDVVHVADIKDDEFYRSGNRQRRALVDVGGARTVLEVALRKDNTLLGAINVFRQEVHPFTDKQIALLQTFAAQAVIAIENARLITEQQDALEQQTATAEVLQVINASPGDLAPVFDTILEKAMRLCDAAFGMFNTYDGTSFHTVVTRGVPAAFAAFRAKQPPTPTPGSPFGRAFETRRPVHIFDWLEEPGYKEGTPGGRATADLGGARTVLNVPLVKDTAVLGMISFYRQQVRPFSDKQIALLENFAAQAVIAMENARLITEQREALEQQTATAEVLQVINASPGDLTPVFDAVLEKAMRLCGAAFGSLYTFDGERFHSAAQRGVPPAFAAFRAENPPLTKPGGGPAILLETRRPHHVLDLKADETHGPDYPGVLAMVELGGVRTILMVPLLKDETFLGYISIYRQEVRAFSDKQIALLESFAAQAVIAMENARLLMEQREALEQQTATAEVLQVINASPGNLAPVFDAMLEKALHLCEAAFGVLWTYDGERIHAVALRGMRPVFAEFLTRTPHSVGPDNAHGRLLHGEPVVHIADLMDDEAYRSGDPMRRSLVELGSGRTLLAVPLRKDEAFLGDFVIYRQEVRPFSDKQIVLLKNFADQAVIAMENARLLDEIRQRQEELRVTFENMGDGVAMFDETPRLVAWNRKFQEIFDVPDALLVEQRTYADYIRYLAERGEYAPEADPEEHVRRLIEQAGQSRTYERIRPDGRVIEVRHNPVPDGGFVLIFSDITERKQNEAEIRAARDAAEEASRTIEAAYRELKTAQANLIQAEKMASLGQLTAGIAHEIKNPLNFVNNFSALSTELIDELRDVLAPEPLGETARTEVDDLTALLKGNLEKVVQHGQRADGIVRSMLDHSRGSSGERRMVDLNALIDEALNLAYHGARAQDQSFNITLERDFGEGVAPIEVNPQDITRVFLNIFANGFYATTRRARTDGDAGFAPTLRVTTIDAGEAVEIRVRDNGTGVPADIRDKLFQPFFTTKPTGEGTGLGLSITYDIVTQQHGGSIAVDSNVGEYSEFAIRLPRQRP